MYSSKENAPGNATADNSFTYTYDAENRIRSADVGGTYYCYIYDGNGLRVEKATASSSACSSPTAYELYWRNIAGNTIAETDGSGSTSNSSYNEYVFFAGRRIAQSNPSSGDVNYYFVDHLGSTRVVTDATGTACWEADYYPYGQEKTPAGFSDTCSTHYKFTGYERDPETDPGNGTGNDYAFARYYSPRLGRFLSADPLDGDASDPQTLNKYAYVRNNPVNLTDPTGMDPTSDFLPCYPGAICQNVIATNGGPGPNPSDYIDGLGATWFMVDFPVCGSGGYGSSQCWVSHVPWTIKPPPKPSQVNAPKGQPQTTIRAANAKDHLQCAADYADSVSPAQPQQINNKTASAVVNGTIGAVFGNIVSGVVHAGMSFFGGSMSSSDVVSIVLSGPAMGVPLPSSAPAGLKGVVGVLTDAAEGVGGLTANIATGVVDGKLAYDLVTFGIGVAKCP
jgi:RHS repeat-associated protein